MATKLRAVKPGEKPPIKPPKSIVEAVEADDVLSELRHTRLVIAKKLDDPNCSGRDMASLSKRLREIGREIEVELKKREEEANDAADIEDEAFDATAI